MLKKENEMRKKNDRLFNSEIQKVLNKLISEEQIAHDFYIACTLATDIDEVKSFKDMFYEIAVDELNDHHLKLVKWSVDNDYDVPFRYKDYENFADEKVFRSVNSLKSGEKAKYYIDKAIEQEEIAIKSYEEAIDILNTIEDASYSLYEIIMQNYIDEKEHLSKLNMLKDAIHNGINLIGF